MEISELKDNLRTIFDEQMLGVLATSMDTTDPPYINLVAFVHTPDLKNLIFATNRDTKKFSNIRNNPKISMLVDNRGNNPADFKNAVAVSVFGFAEEITSDQDQFLALYLSKHPYLENFVQSPKCALLKFKVEEYYYVSQFQNKARLKL
jgi:general stress protein 26